MSLSNRNGLRAWLSGLGIRDSFLLGFGIMSIFILMVVLTSLATSAGLIRSVNEIIDEQLPDTLTSLSAARGMDRLAASGSSLITVRSEEARIAAVQRISVAEAESQRLLELLAQSSDAGAASDLIKLKDELRQNLSLLQEIAQQRINLIASQQQARGRLLANLQLFQQQLTYRVRILEGDSDVLRFLMSSPSPPASQITALTSAVTELIPLSRFYAEIESIAGGLLSASQDPSLTTLGLSEQVIGFSLRLAATTLSRLPQENVAELTQYFEQLRSQALADDGLLNLRRTELTLLAQGELVDQQNQQIIERVDLATAALLDRKRMEIDQAANQLASSSRTSLALLLAVTVLGILGMAAYFYQHVLNNLIFRLAGLSHSMQSIVEGKYDVALPERGEDELGRLGGAVHQFHKVTLEAHQREAELQALNKRLEQLSISDALTGLANRRRFDEVLPAEWARASRSRQPLSVLMIDVDFFKRFNDFYGHQAGDLCLKQITGVIKARITRASDLAARYGGEEFSVVLADCDATGAYLIADQIRQEIESLRIKHEDSEVGVVTVSIGVAAIIPSSESSADELVYSADQALYKAKGSGRNKVVQA